MMFHLLEIDCLTQTMKLHLHFFKLFIKINSFYLKNIINNTCFLHQTFFIDTFNDMLLFC